jgi:hypothetical protein
VLHAGSLQQLGTPMELYQWPSNLFVAQFIGSPGMNLLPVEVTGPSQLQLGQRRFPVEGPLATALASRISHRLTGGLRPEHLKLAPATNRNLRATARPWATSNCSPAGWRRATTWCSCGLHPTASSLPVKRCTSTSTRRAGGCLTATATLCLRRSPRVRSPCCLGSDPVVGHALMRQGLTSQTPRCSRVRHHPGPRRSPAPHRARWPASCAGHA